MRIRTVLILLSLAVLSSACSTSPIEAVTSTPEPAAEQSYSVVAFGDSTTAPREVDGVSLRVYADIVRDVLEEAGIAANVINMGVPSDTTARGMARFERDVLAHDPDLVIIQFGLNDAAIDVHSGKTDPRVAIETYQDNLNHFVITLKKRDCDVILMTPNPALWTDKLRELYGKPPYDANAYWGFNLLNTEYAHVVRTVAKKHHVPLIDVYQRYLDYGALEGQVADDLLLDGMHPNNAGHAMTARLILQQMRLLPQCPIADDSPPRGFTIPLIDLADQTHRQVVVDREPGQYLGHPTTVLLEDNRTIIAVYPKGHGKGPIVMKRSDDAGLIWSERLPTPKNWETSKETPTIYRVIDKAGVKRLILFSGTTPIRMSVSEDDGHTWTPLAPIGDFRGVVPMASLDRLANGDYMALYHDASQANDGFRKLEEPRARYIFKTISKDGGLTWNLPEVVTTHATAHLCEPGLIRSPDGKQIALLLRENSRTYNSFVIFSDDEGETWTEPRELPGSLTGDRHVGKYAPDGRLFISFRDRAHDTPTHGDWAGWVGDYDDIVEGREGQYRVRIMDNKKSADCAYPGVEVLPDGTFVTTTYGHWEEGESPYIVCVRFTLDELDALADSQ